MRGNGPGGLPLARPDVPVSLPIYADNKPIPSGLKPEKGPLQFYNWQEYINQKVVDSFQDKYNVEVQTRPSRRSTRRSRRSNRERFSTTSSVRRRPTSSSSWSARSCDR